MRTKKFRIIIVMIIIRLFRCIIIVHTKQDSINGYKTIFFVEGRRSRSLLISRLITFLNFFFFQISTKSSLSNILYSVLFLFVFCFVYSMTGGLDDYTTKSMSHHGFDRRGENFSIGWVVYENRYRLSMFFLYLIYYCYY